MTTETLTLLIVILGLLAMGAGLYSLERAYRRRALRRWAVANDFKLLSFSQPWITEQSPFVLTSSKAQQVFHIYVLQPDGRSRSGWLLLGSGWWGPPFG